MLLTTQDPTLASSRSIILFPLIKDGELGLVTPADPETLYILIIKILD